MNAGFFDMLHYAGDDDIGAVRDGVNVHLDGIAKILIDQNWCFARYLDSGLDIMI